MAAKAFSILSQVPCITSSINAVTVEVGLALSGLLLEFCDFLMPTSPVFRFSPLNQELCPRHTDDVIHGTWLKILKALAAIRTRVRFKRAKPVKVQQPIAHTHQRKKTESRRV